MKRKLVVYLNMVISRIIYKYGLNGEVNMIKVIIFDYIGVLVGKFTTPFFEYVHELTKKPTSEIEKSFRKHWDPLKIGKTTDKEFWEGLSQDLGLTPKQVEQSKKFTLKICEATPSTLQHVKNLSTVYDLYLLSNSCYGWSEHSFNINGLKPYFKKTFFSHNMGLAKPDPEIYKKAIQEIGVPAKNILFVDDRLENVQAAQKEGMEGIVFTDWENLLKIALSMN